MSDTRIKILVVDDDPFVRSMLKELLESSGYSVLTAENGRDALRKYSNIPDIRLIISDMNMDEMDGLEFIVELRKIDAAIPFVVLTVNTEISVALKAIRSGANDYLLKDENIEDTLLLSIDRVMEKHRLRIENARLMEDLARKNRELERLSLLDPLTDIPNRRYFEKIIAQEWARAQRHDKWLSVIMIDIDDFKSYNDTYGHQEGDECLKKTSDALNRTLKRSVDFIARYGGEEFTAVLPDTDSDGAARIAENMRKNILGLKIPHETSRSGTKVSVSLGVASAKPDQHSCLDDLIALADKALYMAKHHGRNRVEIIDNTQT